MRLASYSGYCLACGRSIRPGQEIENDGEGTRWRHAACGEPAPARAVQEPKRRGHLRLVWDRDPLDSFFEKATREH